MTPKEALDLIRETAETCARLADEADCPRAGAHAIRARFRLPPAWTHERAFAEAGARMARGERWCATHQAWHPGAGASP